MHKVIIKTEHTEDLFFMFNKVFNVAHGYMRNHQITMPIGFDRDALYYYSDKQTLEILLDQPVIKQMLERGMIEAVISEGTTNEPLLRRINNNVSVAKKITKKLSFYKEKHGLSDKQLEAARIELEVRYEQASTNSAVYFVYKNSGKRFSYFGRKIFGDPSAHQVNSFGFSGSVS